MDWSTWVQDVSGTILKGAADAQFKQPYEIERLKIQQQGQNGQMYQEGQPTTTPAPAGGLVLTPGLLMLVGVVVLVVMLRD